MKNKLVDHALSILFVTMAFAIILLFGVHSRTAKQRNYDVVAETLLNQKTIDFGNPLHRALFKDALNVFHPERPAGNDSLLQAINAYRIEQYTNQVYKTGSTPKKLTVQALPGLFSKFVDFILVYLSVMAMSYYAVQTVGLYNFVKRKQRATVTPAEPVHGVPSPADHSAKVVDRLEVIGNALLRFFFQILKAIVYLILFSPAYIIAYSLKSTFETGGYVFMVVLGVISNGLLINYSYKFFTFLINESRKGYVQNAIVKGLNSSYEWNTPDGISFLTLLKPKKSFPSHVLQCVYMNARYQYIPTMKQYASFLITGLIIIEMALNIQGHLCYELLQDILYRYYDLALAIIFGIFLVVKATEILVDYWFASETRKYENAES